MKALIIDDSPTMRMIIARELLEMHCEVKEARDGKEGLEALKRDSDWDFILLDWNMPIMDGITFLRALRKLEGGASPKVVFCTTETGVDHLREAFDAGADEYIMKPFDAAMLQVKILGA